MNSAYRFAIRIHTSGYLVFPFSATALTVYGADGSESSIVCATNKFVAIQDLNRFKLTTTYSAEQKSFIVYNTRNDRFKC